MRSRSLAASVAVVAGLYLAAAGHAVDGVIEINQAKALAGDVTPGDAPGFPVSLTVGGSYRLTSDLTVADENAHGIVLSPGVGPDEFDIDLNGFTVAGPVTCSFESSLSCTANQSGVGRGISGEGVLSLHDGTVRGFASICVDVGGYGKYGHRLRNLQVKWCEWGIYANLALVENIHTSFNRSEGMRSHFGTLRQIVSFRNGGDGISISVGSLEGCTSWFNEGDGVDDSGGSVIRGCALRQNTLYGLNCTGSAKCGYGEVNFSDNVLGTVLNGIEIGKNVCGGTDTCP